MKKRSTQGFLWMLVCLLLMQGTAFAFSLPENMEEESHAYMTRRAEMLARLGMYYTWPMEERIALDAYKVELGLLGPDDAICSLPTEGDLSVEEALNLAKSAIATQFKVDAQLLDEFHVQSDFLTIPSNPQASFWRFTLQGRERIDLDSAFIVELASSSGKATCTPLTSQLLPEEPWPNPPEEDDIPVEEAARIAREYAMEHFEGRHPLDESIWPAYQTITRIYLSDELGRFYGVELNPFDLELFDYFGTYSVHIDPKTGIIWDGNQGNG